MQQTGKPLSELASCMKTYPQTLVNVKVRKRRDLGELPAVTKRITEIEQELAGTGRILVRYSGTEPKVRVMIEGESKDQIHRLAEDLAGLIRSELG
jgi:phosphoglucosamine mutase